MVLELLVEVKRRLDLYQRAEFGIIVFDVEAALIVLFNECMLTTDRNVVDAHVGVVTATQLDFINIVEVDDVQLLLLLVIVFGRVDLERLNNYVVLLWLNDLKDLESLLTIRVGVLQLGLAQLAVECFPDVRGHVHAYLLVLVATQPLPQALDVHMGHRSGALAWRDERIVLLKLVREADPAHCPRALRYIALVCIAILITRLTLVIFQHRCLLDRIDTLPLLDRHLVALVLVINAAKASIW